MQLLLPGKGIHLLRMIQLVIKNLAGKNSHKLKSLIYRYLMQLFISFHFCRLSVGKQSNSNKTPISSPQASGSRGGLRSSGASSGKSLRNSLRNLGSNMSLKKTKKTNSDKGDTSLDSKKLATSLSDFSSEDDQPLVKKHKPLVQVQKLIKKSIANIGRKMKMEPRRSKRGVSLGPMSPSSSSPKRYCIFQLTSYLNSKDFWVMFLFILFLTVRHSSGSSQLQATASSPLSSMFLNIISGSIGLKFCCL